MLDVVILQSRLKISAGLFFIAGLWSIFLAVFVSLVVRFDISSVFFCVIALAGLGYFGWIWYRQVRLLISPRQLLMGAEGFTISSPFGEQTFRWQNVEAFRLRKVDVRGAWFTVVDITYAPGVLVWGKDCGSLGNGWTMSLKDLCALMQSRLDDYRACHAG